MKQIRSSLCMVTAVLGLLASGCSAGAWRGFPAATSAEAVWPQPPEQARVIWVMDIRQHRDLFDETGFWRKMVQAIAGEQDSVMTRPYGVALHPDGGLLVTDPGRALVHFYDWSRQRYVAIGPKRKNGGLKSPVGVAVSPKGQILVADSVLGTVEAFDRAGSSLGAFVEAGVLGRPTGLAIGANEVYVTDATNHQIAVFGLDGRPLRRLGKRGDGPGEFNFPTHIASDREGRLVVTDSMNFRLQVITVDGTFVRSMGRMGDAPGQFAKPKGVAVDQAGRILAVEGLHDALEIFDAEGQLLLHMGSSGNGPGQFWLPAGVAFGEIKTPTGRDALFFVADGYNGRVQAFRFLNNME